MKDIINIHSAQIRSFLGTFLDEKAAAGRVVNKWGDDVISRLKEYSVNGKMIRGSLVLFTEAMYGKINIAESVKLAAAIELFHSGLLIHDDIIDQDNLRRGEPSVHCQYETMGAMENIADPPHFGVSMGICAGDIVFFIGFELLSGMNIEAERKTKILQLFNREFISVGLGQMQDIFFGASNYKPGEYEILKLYLYKTARYTFSLPFMLGGMLAGINNREQEYLEKLGECIGLIFQIKDDELGIFSEKAESGKSPGSDIEGEKKTLFYLRLFQHAAPDEAKKLRSIFGSSEISLGSLRYVRELIDKYNIRSGIEEMYDEYKIKAGRIISQMNIEKSYKEMLHNILKFNLTRTK